MGYKLPLKIDTVILNLKGFYQVNNEDIYWAILDKAKYEVREEFSYDSWGGGVAGHALHLAIPFQLYCEIVNEKENYQDKITKDINKFHSYAENDIGLNEWIEKVFIDSLPNDITKLHVKQETIKRIWPDGYIKAFISHRDIHKKEVSELAEALKNNGIYGFVAHESILPTQEWLNEIENALRTMDMFIVYHKTSFHDSAYCDQEVGFALAKKVPIFNLWRDQNYHPQGFITKVQALKIFSDQPPAIAHKIINLLRKKPEFKKPLNNGLISALCASDSYRTTSTLIKKVNQYCQFTDQNIEKLINAFNTNSQILGYDGKIKVDFLEKIKNLHSSKKI